MIFLLPNARGAGGTRGHLNRNPGKPIDESAKRKAVKDIMAKLLSNKSKLLSGK